MNKKINPLVVGLGYVGLPLFLALSKKFNTYGYDIDTNRIRSLQSKNDTNKEFKEKDFKHIKKKNISDKKHIFKLANFFIITVPTPLNTNDLPDLSLIKKACENIGKFLKKGDIVILESTVYPGVTRNFCGKILENKSKLKVGEDFNIGFSSERINPGDKIHTIDKIFKVVTVEGNWRVRSTVKNVYKSISSKIHFSNKIEEAELSKLIENTQRDLNIALINQVYLLSEKLNIEFKVVMQMASTKWNFIKFNPGLVGGHCLPVDPHYLSHITKINKIDENVILAGRKINEGMKLYFYRKIIKIIKKDFGPDGKKIRILIAGLTYKKNVSDIRNSQAIEILKLLKKNGFNVTGYDPLLDAKVFASKQLKIISIFKKCFYDKIIIITNHDILKKKFNNCKKSFFLFND